MKKIIAILIIIVLGAAVVYVLIRNKARLEETAALARQELSVFPVRAIRVMPGTYTESFSLTGKLQATSEIMVMPGVQGRVATLEAKKGEWVKSGDLLAKIDDKLYRTEFIAAEKAYLQARENSEKFSELAGSDAISGQQEEMMKLQLEGARAKYIVAQEKLAETRVRAPINGYVNQVFTKAGALAGPGNPMFEIVNTQSLTLKLAAGEKELTQINVGEQVNVRVPSAENELLTGQIKFIAVKPDYTGMFPVEVHLDNPGGIKAGMLAEAVFSDTIPESIVVPSNAVRREGEEHFLFLARDGKAIRHQVVVSRSGPQQMIITEGLVPGDSVITEGLNRISDQTPIKIIN